MSKKIVFKIIKWQYVQAMVVLYHLLLIGNRCTKMSIKSYQSNKNYLIHRNLNLFLAQIFRAGLSMGIWLPCEIVYPSNIFKFRFDVYWPTNTNNECMINNILLLNMKNGNKLKGRSYKGGPIRKTHRFSLY